MPERFTLRFIRNGKFADRHFGTKREAVNFAADELDKERAIPVKLLADGEEVMDQQDLLEAWENKYLKGEKPTD